MNLSVSPAHRRPYREILTLSLPISGVQIASVALTSTDILMLQSLGVVAIAGGGLAMQLYNQIRTMCVGMITATGNLVAEASEQWETQRNPAHIRAAVRASMAVGTLTAVIGAAAVIGLGALMLVLPIDPRVSHLTFAMTLTLAPGLLPMIWLDVLRQFAVGMRRPGRLLAVVLVSIAVNATLNWAFISLAPTAGWGVAGIGLSTTLVEAFTLAVFARALARDPKLQGIFGTSIREFIPRRQDYPLMRQVLRLGTPVSLTYGSEAALTTVAGLIMGLLSPSMLAAHSVINQVAYIIYQVNIGFSHGGSILVSRERRHGSAHVRPLCHKVLLTSAAWLGTIGLLWATLAPWLTPLLVRGADPTTTHIATMLLYFAIFHQFSKGGQNILIGLLRGLRDTSSGLRCTLIGYWALGVPLQFLLALGLGWQGSGVWTGLIAGFGTAAVLLAATLRRRLLELDPQLRQEAGQEGVGVT